MNNVFTLTGNIGNDAKVTEVGNARKASFSIAVRENPKSKEPKTSWFNLEAWRNSNAEDFDILKKGRFLKVSGYLKRDQYKDKNGNDVDRILLVATSWNAIEKKNAEADGKEAE